MKYNHFRTIVCLIIVSIICGAVSVDFVCNYGYRLDHGYPCAITKGIFDSDNESVTFSGVHQGGKSDADLKLLSFNGNRLLRLQFIPKKAFKQYPNLTDFSLQSCQLGKLKNGDFQGAVNLKYLNLDMNELNELDGSTFTGATNLEWLSVSSNGIKEINKDAFNGLLNLQMLYLSQNKLQQLHQDTFSALLNLNEVLLNGNQFEKLQSGLFDKNLKLKRIWLQNNQIQQIDPQFFAPLKNLIFLNLEENSCINQLFRTQYRELESLNDALKTCDGKVIQPSK